jgi:hypothetical protein
MQPYCNMALYAAVQSENVGVVRLLLNKKADMSVEYSPHQQTIKRLAVKRGREEMVRLLLDEGANIAAEDDAGQTALTLRAHMAMKLSHNCSSVMVLMSLHAQNLGQLHYPRRSLGGMTR